MSKSVCNIEVWLSPACYTSYINAFSLFCIPLPSDSVSVKSRKKGLSAWCCLFPGTAQGTEGCPGGRGHHILALCYDSVDKERD